MGSAIYERQETMNVMKLRTLYHTLFDCGNRAINASVDEDHKLGHRTRHRTLAPFVGADAASASVKSKRNGKGLITEARAFLDVFKFCGGHF